MKKTPIIAGIVGLGIIGGAYLGTLYYSGSKAISDVHRYGDMINKYSIVDYIDIKEDRGLFSSTVHIIVNNPLLYAFDPSQQPAVTADTRLTLHHGIVSTDIDGKFMLNDPRWQAIDAIRKNEGFDVSAHINTFSEKGNFFQAKLDMPFTEKASSSKGNPPVITFRARIEQQSEFDPLIQGKLRGLITKGINEQLPVKSDGKEYSYILKVGALSDNKSAEIEAPFLYQENSNAVDIATTVFFKIDGQDALNSMGIDKIDGVSHITQDNHWQGSYARFSIPSIAYTNEGYSRAFRSDLVFQTGINDKQAYFTARTGGIDAHDANSHFSMGPASLSMFTDAQTNAQMSDLAASLKSNTLSQQEQRAALKKLITYLPDLHAELHNIALTTPDSATRSLESATLDITRDISAPVTHVGIEALGINGDITHGHFSQHLSVDQSIIDTAANIIELINATHSNPSIAQINIMQEDMQEELLNLIKTSPRIVLNDLEFSADEYPRELKASGEVSVQGDAITHLAALNPKCVNAHFTVIGLPDKVEQFFRGAGLSNIDANQPVNIDFKEGHSWVNGELLH